MVKLLYLVYINEMVKYIQGSYLIVPEIPYKRSLKVKSILNSTIHSDNWKGYDGLVDLGYKKHYRLDHSKDEFVRGSSHINGIEGFWGYAKNRLSKFKGMHKNNFYLHLKESEFRFNYRKLDLYKFMLQYLKLNPLKLS